MNILVVAGGISTERDVSLVSGRMVSEALKKNGHTVILLDLFFGYGDETTDVTGIFDRADEVETGIGGISDEAPDLEAVRAMRGGASASVFGPNVIAISRQADIVFIALHGANGEDGRVQATFDLYGIRYTGSDYLSSAIAMNKEYTKRLFMADGVPTPSGLYVTYEQAPDDLTETGMEFPVVVKPVCGGSSIGVSIARDQASYQAALEAAFAVDDGVLIEEYIQGREFSVGVLEGVPLPVIEIAPVSGWYDYKNKYAAGSTVETCPADLPDHIARMLQVIAVDAAVSLDLTTYARIDMLMDDDGHAYCLEANTLPGMTPTSLLPQEAAAVGISFEELCERIVEISLEKYE